VDQVINISAASTKLCTALANFAMGFTGSFFTVGGPPLMIWVFWYENQINIDLFRSAGAINRSLSGWVKFVTLLTLKSDVLQEWPLYLSMSISAAAALLCGNALSPKVGRSGFAHMILIFLWASALLMITSGTSVQPYVLFALVLCIASGLISLAAQKLVTSRLSKVVDTSNICAVAVSFEVSPNEEPAAEVLCIEKTDTASP
jgi:hypothetical protein